MRPVLPLALVIAGSLAACGFGSKDPDQAQLARGCQIVKCICAQVGVKMFTFERPATPTDALWGPDGSAYCPDGMQLETRDKPSIYNRPLY
jgi:hypothetical protein